MDPAFYYFGFCRSTTTCGPDAEEVDAEDCDQKKYEKKDDQVFDFHPRVAAQYSGLLVHQVFLLPRLLNDSDLVLQFLFSVVQSGDLRFRFIQTQFVLAVPFDQTDRFDLFDHCAEFLFLLD